MKRPNPSTRISRLKGDFNVSDKSQDHVLYLMEEVRKLSHSVNHMHDIINASQARQGKSPAYGEGEYFGSY